MNKQTSFDGKILLVEDQPVQMMLLKAQIETLPLELHVNEVGDGREALAYLESCNSESLPDLIITDYEMPHVNGLELLKKIRNTDRLKSTPIIMITATGDEDLRRNALDAGVNDFLQRPIDQTSLEARCSTFLYFSKTLKGVLEKDYLLKLSNDTSEKISGQYAELFQLISVLLGKSEKHNARIGHCVYVVAKAYGLNAAVCDLLLEISPLYMIQAHQNYDQVRQLLSRSHSPILKLVEEISSISDSGIVNENQPLSAKIVDVCIAFEEYVESSSGIEPIERFRAACKNLETKSGISLDEKVVQIFLDQKQSISTLYYD